MRRFIVGSDWWTDCDDAVAMRIIARAHKCGEIELRGVALNACMEHSAASLKGFLKSEGLGEIPIGIDTGATDFEGKEELSYQKGLIKYAAEYSNSDAEDAVALYRRLLTESDRKLEIIEIGFLNVIVAVLESGADEISPKTGIELVSEKVSEIWVMAGKWDEDGGLEHNFYNNARSRLAGARFCEICPVPVSFLGYEVGADVITGNELKEGDVLRQVLIDHGSPHGRSSWDPMLVLLALTGDHEAAGYDFVQGTARVDALTGKNYFTPRMCGLHRYVIKKKDNSFYQKEINKRL